MLQDSLLLIISLLFAVAMLSMVSEKLGVSYPIFLVIAGLLISFIPGVPHIQLHPDMAFLIFLPPLLYAAAWNTSWKDFWGSRRPIGMLAFGLVVFTSATVAFLAHFMIPDFSWAMGFLLGGIISPPDAVAATSVLQGLKVPKRVVTILEGESLINDASSLIVFRFALMAILTGQFTFLHAAGSFFLVAGMGILIGLGIAQILYVVHRYLPTTPSIDTALTIISPYFMYIAAEHFHYSGVLAVVTGGLFLSARSNEIFAYNSRIQTYAVWETLIFLLNGIVFILIGLQLPEIISGLGQYSIREVIFYSVVISLATIIIRILWVFPGAYLPRILSKHVRTTEKRPGWKVVFLVAWSGMRGVVSLASALAVPLVLSDGSAFPHRNLILFITFIVILITLVLQGLSLPVIIRWLEIKDDNEENEHEQEQAIRLRLATAALDHMQSQYSDEISTIDAYNRLKERYERMIEIANRRLLHEEDESAKASFVPKYRQMLIELVATRREELQKLRREKIYSEELIRNKEYELDLEEARLNET
ncbi:MAG TPA: Na+/H+ antiporter [Chitinophagaceae bacterium]|nr:Na+/H+ antiporter [Chitinophagaceae bacterium]